ncbi:alkaline phosphatase D family protein [Paraglaciecola sp.]|uniref:alkaline phosphatase D family protein n=1 Tax=Paraglaciecola sp. TaxID=1920173 RepID=UPI0032661623
MLLTKKQSIQNITLSLFFMLNSLLLSAATVTDGPLIGGVTDNSARVFMRTDEVANVMIRYDTDRLFTNPLFSEDFVTQARDDFTRIISIRELQADTNYYYQIMVNGRPQRTISEFQFKTFPAPGIDKPFKFAALVDTGNSPDRPAAIYGRVEAEQPAFVLQLGDWDHRDPETLDEMRTMHREVRGRLTTAGLYFSDFIAPSFPVFHMWDDHDYGMENGDITFSGKNDALRAYREYFPAANIPNPQQGIWQSFQYANVEVFMLDTRSNRDPNDDIDDENKSMLDGGNIDNGQKQWLFEGLLNSNARWKVVTSGSPFNPSCKPSDGWGAFNTERQEIVDFINDNNISNVVILTGDIHSGGGIDNGTNSGIPELTVPHTNMNMDPNNPNGLTTTRAGEWSEGLVKGIEDGILKHGMGVVEIATNPHRLTLSAKGQNGEIRVAYTIIDQ